MTTVNTVQAEFWFATGLHVHHYLNGVLTTVANPVSDENPGGDYIPFGVVGTDDRIYLHRAESFGPIGYVGSADLADLTAWGEYDDPMAGEWTLAGDTWTRFQDFGVGMTRIDDNIVISNLLERDNFVFGDVDNGIGIAVALNRAGLLVQVLGINSSADPGPGNLIEWNQYAGVTYDPIRNRLWISNDFYGLEYIDLATNEFVAGPISGLSFYNIARWIEYQESSDTLWVTQNHLEILGLNPDDFSTKFAVPFCSDPFSDDGPYSAEAFAILPNDTHIVIAGEGGLETDFNDGIWMVELATGTKELVIGLDGSEEYWISSDAFESIWTSPRVLPPAIVGQFRAGRRAFDPGR